jgi:single-strand DNA-binding protein
MRGLNKVFLIGNLGADPEIRITTKGTQIARVRLATPHPRKVEGAWVENVDWHTVKVFGRSAEYLGRAAHKGDALALECSLRPNRWTGADGQARYEVDIVAERVIWLQRRTRDLGTEAAPEVPVPELPEEEDTPTEVQDIAYA